MSYSLSCERVQQCLLSLIAYLLGLGFPEELEKLCEAWHNFSNSSGKVDTLLSVSVFDLKQTLGEP
jgi:hypothetical protein